MMMMRILDTFSIQCPIIRVSPYSYNSIIVSILSFDFFLLLLCSTILMSHSCCSPIFSLLYFILFLVRCWFGEDGYGRTRLVFPSRSFVRSVAAATRPEEGVGRQQIRPGVFSPLPPQTKNEGKEQERSVLVLFPFSLPSCPGIKKRSENTIPDGLSTKKK